MDSTERDKMLFDWIKTENELVNKQISAWSEADQKIIAVMATVAGAIIGLASSKYISNSGNTVSYMVFLASVLMTLAVIQSSLYSSLILLALERKVDLAKRFGKFLSVDPDFAMTINKPSGTIPMKSYIVGVVPYLIFRANAGLVLSIAGLSSVDFDHYDYKNTICIIASFLFSGTAFYVTIDHAFAFFAYYKTLGDRPSTSG